MPGRSIGLAIKTTPRASRISVVIHWRVQPVGGLPRPFDRRNFDTKTKTMLSTFRFPGRCFAASSNTLQIQSIRAIHLGLNRGDERPIAFDDLEIVHV